MRAGLISEASFPGLHGKGRFVAGALHIVPTRRMTAVRARTRRQSGSRPNTVDPTLSDQPELRLDPAAASTIRAAMRALAIEDDETTGREIEAQLSRHGFQVDWRRDGQEGLAVALAGAYDVITLDRMLPGLDGLTVVKELRAAGVVTPVLMISALGMWTSG